MRLKLSSAPLRTNFDDTDWHTILEVVAEKKYRKTLGESTNLEMPLNITQSPENWKQILKNNLNFGKTPWNRQKINETVEI